MSGLFMPTVQDGLDLLSIKQRAKSFPEEDIIIFAKENSIYAMRNFASDPKLLKERDSEVKAFMVHNNKLYDSGDYCMVLDTLTDECKFERENAVAINDICSHRGLIYEACEVGKIWCSNHNEVVREGDSDYWAICSHKDGIYNSDCNEIFFNGNDFVTFRDSNPTKIAVRPDYVNVLFSYGGSLYDGGEYGSVYGTANSGITYSEWDLRESDIQGMFAFDNQIYAYNFGGMIYNLFHKKHVHTLGMDGNCKITSVKADVLNGCEI